MIQCLYADGVNVAASHTLISGGLAFGVRVFALKSMFSRYAFIRHLLLSFITLLGCLIQRFYSQPWLVGYIQVQMGQQWETSETWDGSVLPSKRSQSLCKPQTRYSFATGIYNNPIFDLVSLYHLGLFCFNFLYFLLITKKKKKIVLFTS